jgi:hypothetical protein
MVIWEPGVFFFFSSGLGWAVSILISLAVTALLLFAFGVL